MTLCVVNDSVPWCSPVYYIFDKNFYFFSSPDSFHILYGLERKVSASVFSDGNTIKDIRGVQMKGEILIPGKKEAYGAFKLYIRKFKFFLPEKVFTPEAFREVFNSQLYCFIPDYTVYTDNISGFGNKKIIQGQIL
ncbi:MAG: hypothetical protein CSA18_02070 [Deltaproteobacteria bacterium]|nr:MAG: hypothetical protein CSB21_01395 [Deltaproteobacteria bacterium]PIE74924.1 MAG: hypothetical protein CSA18_02070 [Deltaproteobacteria bacterium]